MWTGLIMTAHKVEKTEKDTKDSKTVKPEHVLKTDKTFLKKNFKVALKT